MAGMSPFGLIGGKGDGLKSLSPAYALLDRNRKGTPESRARGRGSSILMNQPVDTRKAPQQVF